mmetsp:Transcript_35565/g.36070  ORF Transcript_35565/g.36070 Transcript_35565/m.36070 type:complete len:142 (+) Transcript_35565:693-1118(+)
MHRCYYTRLIGPATMAIVVSTKVSVVCRDVWLVRMTTTPYYSPVDGVTLLNIAVSIINDGIIVFINKNAYNLQYYRHHHHHRKIQEKNKMPRHQRREYKYSIVLARTSHGIAATVQHMTNKSIPPCPSIGWSIDYRNFFLF